MLTSLRAAILAAPIALFAPASFAQDLAQEVRHLVQVYVHDARDLDRLLALDLDLARCQALEPPVRVVDVIAYDADLARLTAAGLDHEIAIRDLAAHYERELARSGAVTTMSLTPPVGQGGMGGNYTLAQMEAILDSFANDHPSLCTAKVSIGTSIQGRSIWMVKISDNAGSNEGEPRAYFDAVHHAREPVSLSLTLAFMDWLLSNYGTDPVATYIVNERELFFVPCVNPDGYEYNRSTNPGGGGLWRKNRRLNANGTYGVDLNRNYSTGWSAPNGGNSTTQSSDTYRGTAPFSEPETLAIENFMTGMGFALTCSAHTYTDVLLYPWGWQSAAVSNAADYATLSAAFTDDSGIPHGPVSTTLYIAAGGSVDHHHQVHGAISFTPELGRENEGSFWPAPATQVTIVNRHLTMYRDMALAAGSALSLGAITTAEDAGSNGDGVVGPGENGTVVVQLRNAGLTAIGNAQVTLQSLTAGVSVLAGSTSVASVARLGSASTLASQLRFHVDPSFTGDSARLRVTAIGGGATVTSDLDVPTRVRRVLVADDMEQDRGFTVAAGGTATSGIWGRGTTQQTTSGGVVYQPGTQHTPGGSFCQVTDGRAGTAVGTYDVDGGITDLLSPVMDLSHVQSAELVVWNWYGETVGNDAFEIAVSSNGGSAWTTLFSTTQTTSAWTERVLTLPAPLTSQMRFRFRAQDLNASIVEALIDDLSIRGVAADGSLTILSSGAIGKALRVGVVGEAAAQLLPMISPFRAGGPIAVPGIGGQLLLEPSIILTLPTVGLDAAGRAAIDLSIPNDAGLRGAVLHWQGLHFGSAGPSFGNATTLTLN
jgi:carboxypeptidase T